MRTEKEIVEELERLKSDFEEAVRRKHYGWADTLKWMILTLEWVLYEDRPPIYR